MRGNPPLALPRGLGHGRWTVQKPRIETKMTGQKKKKIGNEMIPSDVLL